MAGTTPFSVWYLKYAMYKACIEQTFKVFFFFTPSCPPTTPASEGAAIPVLSSFPWHLGILGHQLNQSNYKRRLIFFFILSC